MNNTRAHTHMNSRLSLEKKKHIKIDSRIVFKNIADVAEKIRYKNREFLLKKR